MGIKREKIKVYEMTCASCENRVEKAIKKLAGVNNVMASYSGQYAVVEYDDEVCSLGKIKDSVRQAGYTTESSNDYKFMGILIVVAAVVLLGLKTSGFDMEAKLSNASYAVLFLVGVLTSIHCVGMCGGIMLSQSLSKESKNKFEAMEPAILYNIGRVISYTVLGGIIGALGSAFSLSIVTKAALQVFAGVFMIMMGFNMAGFGLFRRFHIKLPKAACKAKSKSKTPLLVGIANGLMPCGPLQTMQLFALGTGSATKGALSMFMFAMGTVPLMLTFGAISGLLSKGYTKKILKFSGVLIIVLGVIMGSRGLAVAGININPLAYLESGVPNTTPSSSSDTPADSSNANSSSANKAVLKDGVQTLKLTASNRGYTPAVTYVQKGIPLKLIIDGKQLNSCNNAIIIPSINKQIKLKNGETVVEFTPGDKDVRYSCWMGMIRGTIKVVDDLGTAPTSDGSAYEDSYEEENIPAKPSIYGDDITKVPTDRLVKKVQVSNTTQTVKINGIGYELDPLIIVANIGMKTKLSLDLKEFDNIEGNFAIINTETGESSVDFLGKKGIVEVEFTLNTVGVYAILQDGNLLGVIDAVEDIKSSDIEEVRKKYIR